MNNENNYKHNAQKVMNTNFGEQVAFPYFWKINDKTFGPELRNGMFAGQFEHKGTSQVIIASFLDNSHDLSIINYVVDGENLIEGKMKHKRSVENKNLGNYLLEKSEIVKQMVLAK